MKALQLKIACTVCMLLLGVVCIQAQTIEIKGTVFDSKKETMPGASVYVKGTNIGVITDVNGKYAIKVPSTQSVLVFSFVGYVPQEVVVGNRNVVDIVLVDDAVLLKDVVVIGYGSVKKKDLTGAITSVGEDELQKGTVSPDRMLVGKVAGVQVTPSGGAPGSGSRIRIRGGASLTASNDPLIIIDGIPVENSGVSGSPSLLSTINPNDIESMNILKDASATAIYGSRASNGVIIITTKKAAYGQKVKVDFSTQFSLSSISDKLDLLSGDEIRDIVNNHPKSTSELKGLLGTYNTDWQDAIYQTAFSTDNNLSLSGTLKTIPYRVSLGYLDEDGILKTGNMERWSGSLNLNPRFFDNHLKIDASLKATRINNRFANTDAIQTAVSFDPTQPVKAEGFDKYDGYFTWLMPSGELKSQALTNPVLLLNTYSNTSNVSRVIATTQIDYKMHFLPELRANLNLGYDYSKVDGKTYVPAWAPQMASRGGKSQKYGNNKKNKLLEFYLNYAKEISTIKSFIDVTAGYTYQDWLTHSNNYIDYTADGEEFTVPDFPYDEPRNTLISFFGRLNYTLMDKYLLTVTLRRDGSSRFYEDNRWGTFPSFALAWKIKEESFLKNVDTVSELKLRLGYGQTGQQDIYLYYPYLARYEMSSNIAQYQFGDQFYYMYRPAAYDRDIKWETTSTYNAGVDFGFLDNRITGSVDCYLKKTKDLLATVSVPAGSNFSNQLITNIGSLENKGLEVTLNAEIIKSKDWNWNASFNMAFNKNRITKLTLVDSADYEGIPQGWIFGSTGGTVQIHSVGHNTYSFYLYKQVYGEDGKPLEGVYTDLNGDGKINSKDLYRSKSSEPKMTCGLSTSVSFRNWELSTSVRGSFGNYMYNNMNSALATYSNILSPSKTILNAPRNVFDTNFYLNQPLSDYYLENASFIKMDNLSLSYNFGKIFNQKIGLRATLSVQNVFTITGYSGLDPEIAGGVDRSFYPRPRTYALGFNLNY